LREIGRLAEALDTGSEAIKLYRRLDEETGFYEDDRLALVTGVALCKGFERGAGI
jgi:hypothetical protein